MPIPDFLSDGRERQMRDLTTSLADRFELTEEQRQQLLPSGENKLSGMRGTSHRLSATVQPIRNCPEVVEQLA